MDEGGVWGVARLPAELHPIIRQALALYRGEIVQPAFREAELNRFAADDEGVD